MTTPATTLVGQSIHGLEVREELGRGGMGEVYKAYDAQLDRFVAVKVVAAQAAADGDFAARFLREARAASSVHHPNVAQIHAAGEHDGRPYYVMELVEGQSLDELLREHGPLAGRRCLSYLAQAAQGLRAAHRVGIVHRDIKPGNLMLDTQGRLKIVDFGLARRLEGDANLTHSGVVVGTPAYLAPEQALGGEVDHRADIYALGATFYHLFTGHLPFEADTPLGLLMKHAREPLPPLKERNPRVPQAVCAVIERMLAKDPAERYATYDELLADLRSLAQGSGPTSAPRTLHENAPAFPAGAAHTTRSPARQPVVWLVAGLLFVLGAALWSTGGAGGKGEQTAQAAPPPAPVAADMPPVSVTPVAEPAALDARDEPGPPPIQLPPSTSGPDRPAAATPRDLLDREGRDGSLPRRPEARETGPVTPAPRRHPPLPGPGDLEQLTRAAGAGRFLTRAHAAQTLAQLRRLFTLTQLYLTERGEPPQRLEDLDVVERLPPRAYVDSWGNPVRLEARGESIRLSSAGPDGTFGTADDLVLEDGFVAQGNPLGQ